MKNILYSICIIATIFSSSRAFAQAPENIDIGLFPIGTYNSNPSSGEIFEVAVRTNEALTTFAPEFTLYLEVPTALLTGNEVFDAVEDNLGAGNNLIYQVTFDLPNGTTSNVGFVLNGLINLSTLPLNTWQHVCTITLNGSTNTTPDDFYIADINSDLYTEFLQRSAINAALPSGELYNELLPVSSMPALPLDLIAFKASKFEDRSSYISWTTVNELNTSHFVIQRSEDKRQWTNIGSVSAAGNSLNVENYSYMDANVYNGIESKLNVYYRLVMFDLDGNKDISPIEKVTFGNAGSVGSSVAVYPNPASDGIYVEWDVKNILQPTLLEIYDVTGKLVLQQKVSENANQEYIDFGPAKITSGLYLLRILNGTEPIDHKQIVVGQSR